MTRQRVRAEGELGREPMPKKKGKKKMTKPHAMPAKHEPHRSMRSYASTRRVTRGY